MKSALSAAIYSLKELCIYALKGEKKSNVSVWNWLKSLQDAYTRAPETRSGVGDICQLRSQNFVIQYYQ